MATLSSLLGGLAKGLTASASTPKSSYISQFAPKAPTPSRVVGPYRSVVPTPAASHTGAAASYVNPANAVASKGTVPYVPATAAGGGRSVVPTQTSVATGRPSTNVPGAVSPASKVSTSSSTSGRSSSASTARESYINSAAPSFGTVGATDPSPTDVSTTDTSSPSSSSSFGSSSGSGASFGGGVTSPTGTGGDYRSKYLAMLSGVFSDDELKSSNKQLQKLREQQADTQLEQREQDRYIRDNKAGALARGVSGQVAENDRTSAAHLADLAIAASPYETYLNNAMDAYKAAADYETDDAKTANDRSFTLSEGQSRYVYDPKTGGYTQAANSPKDSTPEAFNLGAGETRYAYDPKTGEVRAIATGADDPKTVEKERLQTQNAISSANTVFTGVDQALARIGPLTTGVGGFALRNVPGTAAYNLDRIVDTVKANIGFAELSAMRAASPTGGALGQVSEMELKYLQSTIASLDTAQNPQQLRTNLEAVKQHYQNWLSTLQGQGGGGGGGGGIYDF